MTISSEAAAAGENAYRETIVNLRLEEGGGLKVASQNRRALKAALEAAAPLILARPVSDAVEAVLIAHQRQSSSACLCGWAKLGMSHPGHQAAMLNAAGVLK